MRTRGEKIRDEEGDPARRRIRTARETHPGDGLLVAVAALVERVCQHECRNAHDERAGHDFQNAHVHLLGAVQYGVWPRRFKTMPWNIPWNKIAR